VLASIFNYLNNGSFLKNVDLQNLQNCVEVAGEVESLFQDGDQQINADSDPDLGFDGVGRCAVKGFDSQMLLDPAEEELHLPALLVNIGDGFCGNGKDIGQVDKTFVGVQVHVGHPAQGLRVGSSGFLACEKNALIGTESQRFVYFLRIEAAVPQIALGANYKESGKEIHGIKPRKVYVSAIHGDDGIFFQREDIQDIDIVYFAGSKADKRWNGSPQIEEGVHL